MASCFVVQLLSCVWLFATPWTAARQASLSFTISRSLLKLMSIELVMPSHRLILNLITWTFKIRVFPAGVRERKEKRQRGFDTWRTCTPSVSWFWRGGKGESKRKNREASRGWEWPSTDSQRGWKGPWPYNCKELNCASDLNEQGNTLSPKACRGSEAVSMPCCRSCKSLSRGIAKPCCTWTSDLENCEVYLFGFKLLLAIIFIVALKKLILKKMCKYL